MKDLPLLSARCLSRREWIKSATLAGLAACSFSTTAKVPDVSFLTLGIGTYGMKSLPTEDALRLIAEIGYDSVELTALPGFDLDPATVTADRRKTLRKQLRDCGLRLTSIMENLSPSPDDTRRTVATERLKRAMELGHDLSPDAPPLVETVLGGKEWAVSKPIFVKWLADWQRMAEKEQTLLAIKPHRSSAMSRPREAIELFGELGKSPWLRMVYDYSHFVFRDMPLEEMIRTSLPWTAMVAVKDFSAEKEHPTFKLPGETGQIDYPALLRAFYAGGYRGTINAEVSSTIWNQKGYDPTAAAKICYANLTRAFEAANVSRPAKPR